MALSRFVIAGAVNTGLTYAIYLTLLIFMPYLIAYTVTYVAGIGSGYALNAYWVFKERPTVKSAAMYPLVYVFNYLLGFVLLRLLVEVFGMSREIAPLMVIAITVPIMYLATKYVFRRSV